MELKVITQDSKSKGVVPVSDEVFAQDFNEPLVHQVIVAIQARLRAGTKAQKTRAEVRGGGAKPWRQKGTGRARAGTSRSPLWRTGGKIFAAKPRSYEQKINKKMFRGAMRSILSELCRQERLVVIDSFSLDSPKTKTMSTILNTLNATNALILIDKMDTNLFLSSRNIPHIDVFEVSEDSGVDPLNLISYEKIIVTPPVLKHFEEWLQ